MRARHGRDEQTHLGRRVLRHEARALGVPLLLEGQQRLLEPVFIDLLAVDDASSVVGEPVGEAAAEYVDGAGAHADVGERGGLVDVDVGGGEEGGEAVLEKLGGGRGGVGHGVRAGEGGERALGGGGCRDRGEGGSGGGREESEGSDGGAGDKDHERAEDEMDVAVRDGQRSSLPSLTMTSARMSGLAGGACELAVHLSRSG